jgi:5-formyltetrahydrofolate cyclo-ligase
MIIQSSRQISKTDLRKRFRRERARLDCEQRQAWDSAINSRLLDYARRERPHVVAAFVAFDGEPELAPALSQLQRLDVRLALPVIRDAPGRADICFRQWSPGSEMQPNRYGIPEPVGTLDIHMGEIDLVLVPLVAWDANGGRLGMGASFYDRLFQPLASQRRPFRLGVAYQLQQVDRIPLDPWDVRLHGVLTENGCFDCPPQACGNQPPTNLMER